MVIRFLLFPYSYFIFSTDYRVRTYDILLVGQALSQLS